MRFYLLICLLFMPLAYAKQGPVEFDPVADVATAQLISSADGVNGASTLLLGLKIELKDEWKTYWRNPGLAGAPPTIDWQGSENLADVDWRWPAPTRMMVYDVETYGYKHEVVYPLRLKVKDPQQALSLKAKTTLLVCREVCIRAQVPLTLDLPAQGAPVDHKSNTILQKFVSAEPLPITETQAEIVNLGWDSSASKLLVEVKDLPAPLTDAFVEGVDYTLFSKPVISQSGDVTRLVMSAEDMAGTPARLAADQALTVTLTYEDSGLVFTRNISPTIIEDTLPSWIWMLLLAVAGGFILNLMPCVLPVLSIKLLSVVSSVTETDRQRRHYFLLSAAGIFVAFWLLAGLFVLLKYLGVGFGWGMQFQSPAFLLFMIPILALFALNLLDRFEIQLPQVLMDKLVGSSRGHFLQGIFAVLLATPCSAPFLGTAVAFALAGSAWQVWMIFTGLALGLALPYLLIAIWPASVKLMPKPGMWMVRFRQVLAVLLVGTLAWLLWLLQIHLSIALWGVFVGLLILSMLLMLWQKGTRVFMTAAVIYGLAALTVVWQPTLLGGTSDRENTVSAINWQTFEPEKIASYVEEGKVVFVDITADWCITCAVNDRAVLQQTAIIDRLNADSVVAMKGDWSKPDPQIEAYLKSYGRYAIPFNQVFGPALPKGKLLPELLTGNAVTEALDQAGR